jgi:hypothetical protein
LHLRIENGRLGYMFTGCDDGMGGYKDLIFESKIQVSKNNGLLYGVTTIFRQDMY